LGLIKIKLDTFSPPCEKPEKKRMALAEKLPKKVFLV
jgi:hypothetical protein